MDTILMNSFRISLIAARMMIVILLLGTATAQSADVIQENGNVIVIRNLLVITDQKEELFDVEFVSETAYNLYGRNLNFQFENEENAGLALAAVTAALNNANPVPRGADQVGSSTYYIPVEADRETDIIAAVGGEVSGGTWGLCEKATNCDSGVAVLPPFVAFTYAAFVPPSGDQPPVADPGGPYDADTGETITFDGSGSMSQDGNISTYSWDFGEGGGSMPGGETEFHSYNSPGAYSVTLTVTDDSGDADSTSTTATIGGGGEPQGTVLLRTDDNFACPGYYIASAQLKSGAEDGFYSMEILPSFGNRLLQGGLNLGGVFSANAGSPGFGAFNIANSNNERQSVTIDLNATALTTPGFSNSDLGVKIEILDNNDNVLNSVTGSPPLQLAEDLDQGFYRVRVSSVPNSPEGSFQMEVATKFLDRAGGGFQGGVNTGGLLTRDSSGTPINAFAAFCISDAQEVEFNTTGGSQGASGAGPFIVIIKDRNRDVVEILE